MKYFVDLCCNFIDYLENVTKRIEKQEEDIANGVEIDPDQMIKQVDWSQMPIYHRGRYRTFLDYRHW